MILAVTYHEQADEKTRQLLKKSISTSYTVSSSKNTVTLSWDLVMANMKCCGVNNYTDFRDARHFVQSRGSQDLEKMVS